MKYICHIRENGREQSCREHSINTAEHARASLAPVRLSSTAYLAGILHDCGKYSDEFQQYIRDAANGKQTIRGSVIHSFAGVSFLIDRYFSSEDPYERLTAQIVAYGIGSHHGMFDIFSEDHQDGFLYRKDKQGEIDSVAIRRFLGDCISSEHLHDIFQKAVEEVRVLYDMIIEMEDGKQDPSEFLFHISLIARLVSSSVMEGDRRDTALFMNGTEDSPIFAKRTNLWDKSLKHVETFLGNVPADNPLAVSRRKLSRLCKDFSKEKPGIYRLNLPTGAGKTLSGLRYALAHAMKHDMEHIYYVAPLLSILDQNAEVIRMALGNDEIVLEHHSNVIIEEGDTERLHRQQLLAENWDAPVIITTLVQMLNTMFEGKTSSVRRFHSLCKSVIIFDEIQSIPMNMLSIFNLTVNFLSRICGATLVLCSATQPCLEEIPHDMLIAEHSVIEADTFQEIAPLFARTKVIDKGNYTEEASAQFVNDLLGRHQSILVVCNKKSQALHVYESIDREAGYRRFHLSASMCMAHRKKVIEEMKTALAEGKRVICISTQVIEAGVDVSFAAVVRYVAGMDSIVQAAGRCNRNAETPGLAPVYVLNISDENLSHLPMIQKGKQATRALMEEFRRYPKRFDSDLFSDKAISFYYKALFASFGEKFTEFTNKHGPSLYELLSDNQQYMRNNPPYYVRQAFKTAGQQFQVFDSRQQSVIVPYGEGGTELIAEFTSKQAENIVYRKALLRRSQEYSVNVFNYQLDLLLRNDGVVRIGKEDGIYVLEDDYYSMESGLQIEPKKGGNEVCDILIL